MPHAVIELDFDPYLQLGDRLLRLETLGVAGAIFLGLVAAALLAGRADRHRSPVSDAGPDPDPAATVQWPSAAAYDPLLFGPSGLAVDRPAPPSATRRQATRMSVVLRRDDLLFIALGAVPGAILGGRLAYGLSHLEFYSAQPSLLIDPGQGSLSLSGAVLGGAISGIYVAALLDAPVGRWLDVLIAPVLLMLGLGKLAMVLGGSGQGQLFDGSWAVAFVGEGPWGSLAPSLPAHPSQVYEAIATGVVLLLLVLVAGRRSLREARRGWLFWLGIGGWALGRALVGSTWRDPIVSAGLRADQIVCLAIAGLAVLIIGLLAVRGERVEGTMSLGVRT